MIEHFDLAKDADFQKYGIGIKELWQVAPESTSQALCNTHLAGLDNRTGGGSWLYHFVSNLCLLAL